MTDDPLAPSHKQIMAITNMVAFYTIGDRDAHSVVTAEAVGVLTGIYKLPQEMDKFEAQRAIGKLIDRKRKKQGRMYHITNNLVADYKSKLLDKREMDK